MEERKNIWEKKIQLVNQFKNVIEFNDSVQIDIEVKLNEEGSEEASMASVSSSLSSDD